MLWFSASEHATCPEESGLHPPSEESTSYRHYHHDEHNSTLPYPASTLYLTPLPPPSIPAAPPSTTYRAQGNKYPPPLELASDGEGERDHNHGFLTWSLVFAMGFSYAHGLLPISPPMYPRAGHRPRMDSTGSAGPSCSVLFGYLLEVPGAGDGAANRSDPNPGRKWGESRAGCR